MHPTSISLSPESLPVLKTLCNMEVSSSNPSSHQFNLGIKMAKAPVQPPPPAKISIYFENFPAMVDSFFMDQVLTKYGIKGSTYIPNKCNQRGLRFGFVQVEEGDSLTQALKNLNMVIIGDHRLRAFQAKYQKKLHGSAIPATNYLSSRFNTEPSAEKRGVRSYAQVLTGVEKVEIGFNTDGKNLEWLSRSARIEVASYEDLPLIADLLRSIVEGPIKIASLGLLKALVTFPSVDLRNYFLKTDLDCVKFLILDKAPWSSRVNFCEREVWVRVSGVPLQAWFKDFFKFVGDKLGRFLAIDKDTENRDNLEVARIKIAMLKQTIVSSMTVEIDGQPVLISVEEEKYNDQDCAVRLTRDVGNWRQEDKQESATTEEKKHGTRENLSVEESHEVSEAQHDNIPVDKDTLEAKISTVPLSVAEQPGSKEGFEVVKEKEQQCLNLNTKQLQLGALQELNPSRNLDSQAPNILAETKKRGEGPLTSKVETNQGSRGKKITIDPIPVEVKNYIRRLEKKAKMKHKKKRAVIEETYISDDISWQCNQETYGSVKLGEDTSIQTDMDVMKEVMKGFKKIILPKRDGS